MSNKWNCPKCTAINAEYASTCHNCGALSALTPSEVVSIINWQKEVIASRDNEMSMLRAGVEQLSRAYRLMIAERDALRTELEAAKEDSERVRMANMDCVAWYDAAIHENARLRAQLAQQPASAALAYEAMRKVLTDAVKYLDGSVHNQISSHSNLHNQMRDAITTPPLIDEGSASDKGEEPFAFHAGIHWKPGQTETVAKLTRKAQPQHNFSIPLYTRPQSSEPTGDQAE